MILKHKIAVKHEKVVNNVKTVHKNLIIKLAQ